MAHNKDNTCLSEERLTTLIREIFREEFEKQQKNLLNLISGNLEITMKEIKSIKTEMNDLKKSIEFTENVLEEKVQKCQEKAEHLDERIREIYEWQLDPEYVHNKLVDLEDRSRRNNLRIDGIKEKAGESWEDCEAEVEKLFREKLDIEHKIIIKRAYRAKKTKNSKKDHPSTIICRLLNFKDKENILKNCRKLKGTNIFVNEDFSQETLEHRRELWKEVKRLREEEDKIAYLNYRSIVVRSKNTER